MLGFKNADIAGLKYHKVGRGVGRAGKCAKKPVCRRADRFLVRTKS